MKKNPEDSKKNLELAAKTRFPTPTKPNQLSKEQKIEIIADSYKTIMETLGLDLSDDSLARTPQRIAKMFVNEIFSGLDQQEFPEISFIEDKFQHDQKSNMVLVKVNFCSFCEHHFVPMNGAAYVAYIPKGKLIGLSKIPRLVRFFSRRPQVQERLTAQIADSMALLCGTDDVAVSITAQHFCVIARGIEDEHSHTITNCLRGLFDTNDTLRREFFEGINRGQDF